VLDLAQKRKRRGHLAPTGKLNVLAADHPARGVVAVGDDALRMADRHDFLRRIVRVLSARNVDGVMASMDVLEELLLLDYIGQKEGRPSFLDERLLIVSTNRGGISGTSWELADPVTGGAADTCATFALDGAKLLWRFDEEDPSSLETMVWCADAIRDMNELGLPTFLEPLPATRTADGVSVRRDASAIARLTGIATALGDSSRNVWLKLPYCADFATVCNATTCPILLLGGPASGRPEGFVSELADALEAGGNVRGVMLGRNVLYPGRLDPQAVAEIVGGVIHDGWSRAHALSELENASTSGAFPTKESNE
jgi:hypothetical protein